MGEKQGWIKLHRKIQDCFLWEEKPYDKARAWIDLLLSAAYYDKKIGDTVKSNKGSFATSSAKLAERWGWSRNKVNSFLAMLESEQMIHTTGTSRGTAITIVNYEKYQVYGTAESTTGSTARSTTESTAESTQKKNLKNYKNDKNIYKNNIVHSDAAAEELFDKLWLLYPVKKGKGQVSLAAKKRLLKIGFEEMERAVNRYLSELEKDSSWRKPQNGSTFFNSGYVDYLNANYAPEKKEPQNKKPNMFNSFEQRNYSSDGLDSLEKKLLSMH
ncbi:MAG: hypothetical protein K1W06_08325 [Lachnospiraceae bacterium]